MIKADVHYLWIVVPGTFCRELGSANVTVLGGLLPWDTDSGGGSCRVLGELVVYD